MAKKFKNYEAHEPVYHKTSIGRKASKAKMNKDTRRGFSKKYRGQGK
jgi:hypothetical protein|tara:strand:+ start:580 stop:720 length:141 start_codon:yes stop_codon:yes gene_type:complete